MKKHTLIGVLLFFTAPFAFCRPIDVKEAQEIAQKFCQQNNGIIKSTQAVNLSLAYICTDNQSQTRSVNSDAYYYVFNKSDKQGFIIVSGESKTASSILGYSDNGEYLQENQPENFKAWMDAYKEAIKCIIAAPEFTKQEAYPSVSSTSYAASVTPLLGRISWNQGEPYNLLCPTDKNQNKLSVTGCVATAMAQIMKYHKWPERGVGSNSYTTQTLKMRLSADFSQSVYDWNNMSEIYSASSTDTQKKAVALLMRDCGIAADMDYSANLSGAASANAAIAMIEHFNYDIDLQYYDRECYTAAQWEELLKEELNAGRPLYYDGTSKDGAHAFVCDGYDTNNLYHMNWGWGGVSNGYFDVRTLSPGVQGIGGSSGGYNFSQGIIAKIQKPDGISSPDTQFRLTASLTPSVYETTKGASFDIQMGLRNKGTNTIDPEFGLALFQDGTLKQLLVKSSFSSPLPMGYGIDDLSLSVKIPTSLENGTYLIHPVYHLKGSDTSEIVFGKIGMRDYLAMVVEGSKVKMGYFEDYLNLEPTSGRGFDVVGKLYQGKAGRIALNIKNTGSMEYTGLIYISLRNSKNEVVQFVTYEGVSLQPDESTKIEMSGKITVPPGTYNMAVSYDKLRDDYIYALTETQLQVTVYPTPTDPAILSLTQKIDMPKPTFAQYEELEINANLTNTGGAYYDRVIAFIFNSTGGGYNVDAISQDVFIENGETTSVTFKKQIDLEPGEYKIELCYFDKKNEYVSVTPSSYNNAKFTVTPSTEINNESTTPFTIYPNPVKDILYIRPEENIKNLSILSVSGEQLMVLHPESSATIEVPVSELAKGMYLLRIETEKETNTRKFIKE